MSGAEIMGAAARPRARGPRAAARRRRRRRPADEPGRARDARARAARLPRYPLRVLRSLPRALPEPRRDAVRRAARAPARVGRVAGRAARCARDGAGGPTPTSTRRRRRSTGASRRTGASPSASCRSTRSRRSRTRTAATVNDVVVVDLRRRGAALADRARRAARTSRWSPRSRCRCAPTTQFGTYGNRILLMGAPLFTDEPDPVERLQPTHEALTVHEGAPPRAARRAAPGRQPLHPARGVRARGAAHVPALDRRARAARPGTS